MVNKQPMRSDILNREAAAVFNAFALDKASDAAAWKLGLILRSRNL